MLRVFAQRKSHSPTRERGAALSILISAFELLAIGSFQRREQRVTLANHRVPSLANASGYDKTRNIKTYASGYNRHARLIQFDPIFGGLGMWCWWADAFVRYMWHPQSFIDQVDQVMGIEGS